MTIAVGNRIPQAELLTMTPDGTEKVSTDAIFGGRKVVLFAVPGAFTPTCSMNHLPGFVDKSGEIKAKGIDDIVCVAVNDVHVMNAWGRHSGCEGKVKMMADGNGDFARKLGLEFDLTQAGMGKRSRRYSMIVEDGVVKALNVEDKPGVNVSGADRVLQQLN
ncbi:MAG: peroxiredoxin [Hyphomicrobiales bacterium]